MRSAEDEIRERLTALEEAGWPHPHFGSAFARWAENLHPRGRGGVFVRSSNKSVRNNIEATRGARREKLETQLDKGLKKEALKKVEHHETEREKHIRHAVENLKPNEKTTIDGTKITVARTHHKAVKQYDIHDEQTSRGKRRVVGRRTAAQEAVERHRVAFHGKEDPGTVTKGKEAQKYEPDFAPAKAGTAGETAKAVSVATHDKTETIAHRKEQYDRVQPEGASQDAVTPALINATPLKGANNAFERGIGAAEPKGVPAGHPAHHTIDHVLGKADPGTLHKVSDKAMALHHGATTHMSGTGIKRHLAGKAASTVANAVSNPHAHQTAKVIGHAVRHLVASQYEEALDALERAIAEGDARKIHEARSLVEGVGAVLRSLYEDRAVQEAAHPVPFDATIHPRGRGGRFIRDAWITRAGPAAQAHLKAEAQSVGVEPDVYAKGVSMRLASLLKDAKVNIRVPSDATLESILRDGEYRPSLSRREVETPVFGEPPVYGYLTGVKGETSFDDGAHKYGYDRLVLKDAVRDRATVTVGDSLGHLTTGDIIPALLSDPNPTPLSVAGPTTTLFAPYDVLGIHDINPPRQITPHAPDYFEAQVHGGVKTADIDHVVLANEPSDSLKALLAQRKIPWRLWKPEGLTEAFDSIKHPRGRGGEWVKGSGFEHWAQGDVGATIGATPFRGKEDPGTGYFDTATFKGYENRVTKEAAKLGYGVEGIDKVSGVWGGGGEPSSQIHAAENDPAKVTKLMDRIGSTYNQDGVIAFIPGKGSDTRIVTNSIVDPDKVTKRLAEYDKIPGATLRKDGRLELIHMPGSYDSAKAADAAEAQMVELLQGLGVGFDYEQGQGILRLAERDYQRRGNKRIAEGHVFGAAVEAAWSAQGQGLQDDDHDDRQVA